MTSPVPDWLQVTQAAGETVAGIGAVAAVIISLRLFRKESDARRDEVKDRKEQAARLVSVVRDSAEDASALTQSIPEGIVDKRQMMSVVNRGMEPIRDVVLTCRIAPYAGRERGWLPPSQATWDVIPPTESRINLASWHWQSPVPVERVHFTATVEFTDVNGHRWSKGLDGVLQPVRMWSKERGRFARAWAAWRGEPV